MNRISLKYRIAIIVFILEAIMLSLVLWRTLQFSNIEIQAAYRKSVIQGIVIAGISMVAIAVAGILIGHFLIKRLDRLNYFAKQMAGANLGVTSDISGSDEIAQLSGSFNDMAQKIRLNVQSLNESQERLTSVLDSLDAGVYVADMKTYEILFINKHARKLFGDITGNICYKTLQLDKSAPCEFCTNDKLVDANGEPTGVFVWEHYNPVADLWVELHDRAIRWIDGRVVRLEIATDITERKRAEGALQKSEANLRRAEKIAKIGNWEWNILTNELLWSEEVYRLYGIDPLKGKPSYDVVEQTLAPECRDRFVAAVEDAVKLGKHFEGEYRIISLEGKVHYTHTIGEVVRDQKGQPVSMFGVVQDITARKQMEARLQENEQKLSRLIETAQEGVWMLDAEAGTTYVNKRLTEMLGYGEHEVIGRRPFDFMDEENRVKARQRFERRRQGVKETFDICFLKKDGARLWGIVSANPIMDVNGRFAGSFSMITDITERKLAEEQVRASLREKEVLLKEIHHRVKNNMQIINSLLSLQAGKIKDKKTVEQFRESQNRIRSMAVIHEMLYKSKELASINCEDYFKHLAKSIVDSYGTAAERIVLQIDAKGVSLDIDTAIPCGLIVNELVSNSLKHAFPGGKKGEIRIFLQPVGEQETELIVGDNGTGIPPNLNFKKTDSLGLHLVNILTEKQIHGTIELLKPPGTTFKIRFRRRKE